MTTSLPKRDDAGRVSHFTGEATSVHRQQVKSGWEDLSTIAFFVTGRLVARAVEDVKSNKIGEVDEMDGLPPFEPDWEKSWNEMEGKAGIVNTET